MKFAVTALGMLASVASAHSPLQHLHFPRANTTAPDGQQTTLTVIATQVKTITSCAPTVTNCPADKSKIASLPESQRATVVVTETVVLSTTVCPVTEASSISASIINKASSQLPVATSAPSIRTTAIHPSIPLTTGGPGAPTSKANAGSLPPGVTTTDIITSKTLTMTLGTGTDTSVITTTVRSTLKKTVTVTRPQSGASNLPASTGPAVKEDSTTTTTATSKVTHTVTVSKVNPTGTGSGVSPTGVAPPGGNPGGNCQCPAVTASTVTVTAAASTVYVTVGSDATKTAKQPTVTDKGENTNPEDCPESTTTRKATVTVVPYPSGNGTHATSGKASASASGFARLRR